MSDLALYSRFAMFKTSTSIMGLSCVVSFTKVLKNTKFDSALTLDTLGLEYVKSAVLARIKLPSIEGDGARMQGT